MNASRVAFFALWAGWIAYAIYYVSSPLPPHNFATDLGYSIVGVGRIGTMATSPFNVADLIGWGTWNDLSSYFFSPMGEYWFALPLEWILRNPVQTIKLAQVLQFTLAFVGMARLYATAFREDRWRYFAAFIYTIIPLSSSMVQWESGFGWVVALCPWAVWLSLQLGRRFGARAALAAGVLCGFATFCFAPEQGILVGFPLVVLTLVLLRRQGIAVSIFHYLGAFAACGLMGAYFAIPTVYGPHAMWWASDALHEFGADTSNERQLFGQGILMHLAGIYQEQMLASDAAYNVSKGAPYAAIAGTALWLLVAFALFFGNVKATLRRWWPMLAVGIGILVLASGMKLPYVGAFLWQNVVAHVPVLSALRTPDRFAQFAALFLALGGACGAAHLYRRGLVGRVLAGLGVLLVVAGYATYAVREDLIGFEDPGHLPDFAQVNAAALQIGGRTAVFAFPLGGSPVGFAAYAPQNPSFQFSWALMQRFATGDGGAAIFRRAAARSIVTTPVWTSSTLDQVPADMALPIARSSFVRAAAQPSGARVFTVESPRAMVAPEDPVCVFGGPAGFEVAAGLRFLDAAALIHGAHPSCVRTVLADADPLDVSIPANAVATWSGTDLFGTDVPLPQTSFEIDRLDLTAAWYANSYEGDSLLSSAPCVIDDSRPSRLVSYTIARPGAYALYVRVSGPATVQAARSLGHVAVAQSTRTDGFRWIQLPLGNLAAGTHEVKIVVSRYVRLRQALVIDEAVLAPLHVEVAVPRLDAQIVTEREFTPRAGIDARAAQYVFPRPLNEALTAASAGVKVDAKTAVGIFNDEAEIRTNEPRSNVRFRWDGANGTYIVAAAAWLPGPGSRETVSDRGQTLDARYDKTRGNSPTQLIGYLNLRRGDEIDVTLTSYNGGTIALTQLILFPIVNAEVQTDYDDRGETWHFDAGFPLAMMEAARSEDVFVADGALRAPEGTSAVTNFKPDLVGGSIIASLEFSGGSGHIALQCGAAKDIAAVGAGTANPANVDLVVDRSSDDACALRTTWKSADFAVKSVTIRATGTIMRNWKAPVYFTAGRYRWAAADVSHIDLLIDGKYWGTKEPRSVATGMHELTVARGPLALPALQFTREGVWPVPRSGSSNIVELSSTHWKAQTGGAHTLEAAELNDGYWFARGSGFRVAGYDCDLVNTCFDVSGAQDVSIGHAFPAALALGFLISGVDVAMACALLLAGDARRRAAARDTRGS